MANILGNLLVELGINTASFKDGLSKASYQAQQFANDVKAGFGGIGQAVSGLRQQFSQLAPGLSNALSGITSALKPLAAGFAGVAVGVVAVAAAAVATAAATAGAVIKFAEMAARLQELSQQTGIAVETLSLLGQVAETRGVGIDQLAKGLGFMAKNALAAAQAGPGARNAFRDLGISVTESNGSLKDSKVLFDEVAAKFAQMADGPLKAAEAKKIFGRAGMELIPLLNMEGAKVLELESHFQRLHAVISGPTAKASEELKENQVLLGKAFEGVSNQLSEELLPALNTLFAEMITLFEDNEDEIHVFIQALTVVTKSVITLIEYVLTQIKLIATVFRFSAQEAYNFGSTVAQIFKALKEHDVEGVWQAIRGGSADAFDIAKNNAMDFVDVVKDGAQAIVDIWTKDLPNVKPKNLPKGAPEPADDKGAARIEEKIEALEAQATAEGRLANAIQGTASATIIATAAAQAEETIQKLVAEAKRVHTQVTEEQKERVREATLRLLAYKEALNVNKILETDIIKTREHTQALLGEAAAYSQTAQAVKAAQETAKLIPYIKEVTDLEEAYGRMTASGHFSAEQLTILRNALEAAKTKLQEETKAIHDAELAQEGLNAAQFGDNLKFEITQLASETSAVLAGADAVRQYTNEKRLAALLRANPFLSPEDAALIKQEFTQLEALQRQLAAAQFVASHNRAADIEKEIAELKKLREQIMANGQSTLAVDAAIHTAEQQRIKDLSTTLLATGNIKNGIHAFFLDFANNAKITGQKIYEEFSKAFSGINQNLAQLIVEGQANWRQFFASFIEGLIEMGLQWVETKLMMMLVDKLFGKQRGADTAGQATAAANLAAANTLALTSAIFLPPVPEALAGAALAEGLGFAAAAAASASFDRGGIVSRDMTANVHKDEMVLPPNISKFVQQAAATGGDARPTVVLRQENHVSAIDHEGVAGVLRQHVGTLAQLVMAELRRQNIGE